MGLGNVAVIDTATDTVVATINDASFNRPYAVAVSPDGREAWVANNNSFEVSVIDTATNTVTRTISDLCFSKATGVVFNPVKPEAYVVALLEGYAVCVVDTDSSAVVDVVPLDPDIFSAEYAVVTPNGKKVYVTGSKVSIIDTDTRAVRSIVPVSLSTVTYLAVTDDGSKVYAAGNDSFLEIIDSSSADFNNDDFTDEYVDFTGAFSINAVTIVPGTNLGVAAEAYEGSFLYAFDTVTDTEIPSANLPFGLDYEPFAIIAIGGAVSPPPGQAPPFDISLNALGAGGCSVAPGGSRAGGGFASAAAGLALWLGVVLGPLALVRRVHGRRRVRGATGLLLLFVAAGLLIAAGAQAGQISPRTQRFHPTTDGLGAFTIDSDETIGQGKLNLFFGANYVKRPLNKGNVSTLTITEDRVHNLLTFDVGGAYGLTPNFELGLDVPFNLVQDGKDARGTDVTDSDFGDIRVNGKWRFHSGPRGGLALVPFAAFPTGEQEVFLTQKKFSYGAKLAGRYAATARLALFAEAGVDLVSGWTKDGKSPDHYTAWLPFGVGAAYDLAGKRKQALVGEINGETIMDKPFGNRITTPVEWLLGYRREVSPAWTLQLGGGRGFNKGIGAPQWRAFLGIAYLK